MHSSGTPGAQSVVHISAQTAFADLKAHSSGHRISTELVILESLRKAHPDFYVTRTSQLTCDLLGYAGAGHATSYRETEDESFELTRGYQAPSRRLDNQPGSLFDRVHFALHRYSWDGKDFLIYQNENSGNMGHVQSFYILSPRSSCDISDGHCSSTDALILACGKWTSMLHDEIYVFDGGAWSKSRDLWSSVHGSSWDEVILDPSMKASIVDDVHGFFNNRDLYKQLAIPWKRGIIFHGVPGNGKTISIKALMSSLASLPDPIPSLYVKSLQACQYSVRTIFSQARYMAPCLLIFEDLDSLVTNQVRSYFLNEVDGLESNDGILMIGSANYVERLDPAISKRPSRFDRKYHFKIPGEDERLLYCQYWRQKIAASKLVDFPEELCLVLAKMTEGLSFAYLKEMFVMTLLAIARGGTSEEEPETLAERDDMGGADEGTGGEISGNKQEANNAKADDIADDNDDWHDATPSEAGPVKEKERPPAKRRAMPEVEIPRSLQDKVLLKVARHQIKTLLDEINDPDAESYRPAAKFQTLPFPVPALPPSAFRGMHF
ncbi:hypothetical protein FGG08_003840 [Glutinoglossum americanum]|uniref:ATPase AAA-type core domain-containing protein n=1 Tax=Glutinoglossum americanum TaxID=1670608 RepID=A0A9P8HXG2_9PEZI|nr:hypothetical protein FGG08_003840 [Glutinoglossum americanum]